MWRRVSTTQCNNATIRYVTTVVGVVVVVILVVVVVSDVVNLLISRVQLLCLCSRKDPLLLLVLVDDGQCTLTHSCTLSDDFSSTLQHARPLQT
jgi:hypothetical protein